MLTPHCRLLAAFALATHLSAASASAEPDFTAGPRMGGAPGDTRTVLGKRGPLTLAAMDTSDRRLAGLLWSTRGDRAEGGAGQVTKALAGQIRFHDSPCETGCNAPCNTVLLVWFEESVKPSGVDIFVDGDFLGQVPGLPAGAVPGANAVNILNVPAGTHTFEVRSADNGTSSKSSLLVLDNRPFSNPTSFTCAEGAPGKAGTCELDASWESASPPTSWTLILDDTVLGGIDGTELQVTLSGVAPGEHCLTLIGQLVTDQGVYTGCPVETCCTLKCGTELECLPPTDLLVCQVGYQSDAGDNFVRATWDNPVAYAGGIVGYVDGNRAGTISGLATVATFAGVTLGPHTFGIQGDCGAEGASPVTEAPLTILKSTPHPNPVSGAAVCEFDPDNNGVTTISWTNADPSEFIDIAVLGGDNNVLFILRVPGSRESATLSGTRADDEIVLQFFRRIDGTCYGSPIIPCQRPPAEGSAYIPGVCNGGAALDISSAIFILNFLFSAAAPRPPCFVACNCNGDERLDISDSLCVLNFLFKTGPAPVGWVGEEETCVEISIFDNCESPNPACPP